MDLSCLQERVRKRTLSYVSTHTSHFVTLLTCYSVFCYIFWLIIMGYLLMIYLYPITASVPSVSNTIPLRRNDEVLMLSPVRRYLKLCLVPPPSDSSRPALL